MLQKISKHSKYILFIGITLGFFAALLIVLNESKSESKLNFVPNSAIDSINKTVSSSLPKQEQSVFPSKTSRLIPDNTIIALYGNPEIPTLGSLGEQNLDLTIARVNSLAAEYKNLSSVPIYPAFEIITTIASSTPTQNGDYSSETDISKLKPWVDRARAEGIYVILDLQPGNADFLSQAKMYESLLKEPHVGLALDPEWRLKPGKKHMKQIGSVSAAEINQTATWLSDLCIADNLPQKLFLIHQFKLSMIENRELLDASRAELAWVIQMDGLGQQNVKKDTWNNIRQNPPAGINFGWKNFIDEDKPMLLPDQTMQITPRPSYISYQ